MIEVHVPAMYMYTPSCLPLFIYNFCITLLPCTGCYKITACIRYKKDTDRMTSIKLHNMCFSGECVDCAFLKSADYQFIVRIFLQIMEKGTLLEKSNHAYFVSACGWLQRRCMVDGCGVNAAHEYGWKGQFTLPIIQGLTKHIAAQSF